MKTRYLLTFVLLTPFAWLLGPGCTQDFDVFKPCDFGEKVCDDGCVSTADAAFGCASEDCDPCDFENAGAACDDDGACAISGCSAGWDDCDDDPGTGCEVNILANPSSCGACGAVCDLANATAVCNGGDCEVNECDDGWANCDADPSNGCETDTDTDSTNCGGCRVECVAPRSCQDGACTLVCDPGTGNCDGDPSNGCETPLGTVQDCGDCGDACDLANATAACTNGMCEVAGCDTDFDDCDGDAANGCEENLQTSEAACGACGSPCPSGPNGTTICIDGSCELTCDPGFGDCDGVLDTGCETDTDSTDAHCGGCGQLCSIANGTGGCNGGVCEITMCNAPFDDCNADTDDGCETDTDMDPAHCGGCASVCSFPNAQALCMGGSCALGPCNGTFADCDSSGATGCETDLASHPMHCGACNDPCPAGPNAMAACAAGMCGLTCLGAFDNCDANDANGCEIDTDTHVDHCGACARACVGGANVASKSCAGGLCDSTCVPGRANCTMPAAGADNGCETAVGPGSDANCGGCGNDCTQMGGGMDCIGTVANPYCACDGGNGNAECNGGAAGVCLPGGSCQCGGAGCNSGEVCIAMGMASVCGCEANANNAPCLAGTTCCDNPAGCFNLLTDAQSCGACGHECPAGFLCTAGACACDADADCDGGSAGTCNPGTGLCTCAMLCTVGKRCMPNGQCG